MKIKIIPCLQDNYAYLIIDEKKFFDPWILPRLSPAPVILKQKCNFVSAGPARILCNAPKKGLFL